MKCDYDIIAAEYDALMQFIPYELWTKYIFELYIRHKGKGKRCADLGCGTGNISIPLAGLMFEVYAFDSSLEMLRQLQKKRGMARVFPVNADITEISLKPFINLAVSMYDTVNHLTGEGFAGFMKCAFSMLEEGGLLMFDFNTKRGLANFSGASFSRRAPSVKSLWNAEFDEKSGICTLNLTIEGAEKRSETTFQERVMTSAEVIEAALCAGFKKTCLYDFLSEDDADDLSERVMAVCIR